jgi:hypothetical protein
MFTPKRKRLSYANVTATLALAFSLTGGALAASHYIINSTKQINPRVLRQLKGETGAVGAQGTAGLAGEKGGPGKEGPAGQGAAGKEGPPGKEGATGKEGVEGKQGVAGKEGVPGKEGLQGKEGPAGREGSQGKPGPPLAVLASGETLKGSFGGGGSVVTESANTVEVSISYPFPLAVSPAAQVVQAGGPPTTTCPGSNAAPSAAAGHLCVYLSGGHEINPTNVSTYGDDGSRDYRYGAVVYAYPTCKAPCHAEFWGTWAVTAP